MASNIKLGAIGTSAGLNTSTTTVSGSYVATAFLTGSISGVRNLPDTPGTLSGTSPRPYGQQYEFIEFDGKLPGISIDTISSPDSSSPYSGKRINITISISGIQSGESGKIYVWINGQNTNEYYFVNSASNGTGIPHTINDTTNTYIVPNSINTVKLVLTIDSTNKTANDSKTVFVYPLDLTIQSISQTPALTGATTYNYTTGSISFNATVAGGIQPYSYNWNSGVSSANPYTFDNSSTTTDKQITLVVTDSNTPTADTANGTGLPIMRRPISVTTSNASISEPFVSYQLSSTINYNVESAGITYDWILGSGTGYMGGSGASTSNPNVYYTTLGSKTHRLNITGTSNTSIRNYNTSTTTVQVSPTANVLVTYTTATEKWSATFDSTIDATYGTRTYEYQGRSKDSGGSYTAWGNSVSVSSNSISAQSFSGKTNTAQYVQIRVRVRRTYSTFDEVSSWVESNEALVPTKGVASIANQTNILTGADRSFTGTVTIGGSNDNGFSVQSVSATSTDSSISASGSKTASGQITIIVNNPCTSVNDGTATHIASITDGNGYHITASFSTQYKINSTNIGLSPTWVSGLEYTNAYIVFNHTISYAFTTNNFQYKTSSGGTYANVTSGGAWIGYQYYSAPAADQTWYYRTKSSGGDYTESDYQEVTITIYGYPNQGYGYSIVTLLGGTTEGTSGTLSQVSGLKMRVKRTGGSFAGISADFYYTTPTGADFNFVNSISDSSIPDSDTLFTSNTYSLYNSSTFITGLAVSKAILTYTFLTNKSYLHSVTSNFTVNREPGSLTISTSGLVSGYAIRGNNLGLTGVYNTPGPPAAALYNSGGTLYSLIYLNIDSAMNTPTTGQTSYYTIGNGGPFFRSNTSGGYGRYTQSSGKTKTPANAHVDVTYTFYANTYQVQQPSNYTYYSAGDDFSTSVTYTVKGKRVSSISGTQTYTSQVGNSIIWGLGGGTWFDNVTGPDGAVSISSDYVSYNVQYSSDNSNWSNLGSGISEYNPGTYGTTYFRIRTIDDWGTSTYTTSFSVTTRDWDYNITLTDSGGNTDIRVSGGAPSYSFVDANYPGVIPLSTTDPGAGNETVVSVGVGYATNFLNISGNENDGNFPGVYVSVDNGIYGNNLIKLNYNTYYGYYVGTPNASQSSVRYTVNSPFDKLLAYFTAAGTYGVSGLLTITSQKSSSNTANQKKWYFRWRTPSPTNDVSRNVATGQCGGIYLEYRTGTINTAYRLTIQQSSDNSTFTDTVYTYTSIASNTNYSAFIEVPGTSTKWYRVRLLDSGGGVLATGTSYSYSNYAAGTAGTYSYISTNTACSSFSYRVDRGVANNSNSNATFSIKWAVYNSYGTELLYESPTFTGKAYNTNQVASLAGWTCGAIAYAYITPYSVTGCAGTEVQSDGIVYKSISIDGCSCASGGDGCLAYGTQILMYDGSYKNVENLVVGDIVKSLSINGLASGSELAWKTFETNDFKYEEALSIIHNIQDDSFNQYYLINNNLKATFEHPIFIKRNDICMFEMTENLVVGDCLFKSNNEFEMITSIDIIDEPIQTININIEENDVYFGNNILVHNVAGIK